MPKVFNRAVKAGGRVRTINPKPNKYLHIVYPKGGGRPIAGEVHTKKSGKR